MFHFASVFSSSSILLTWSLHTSLEFRQFSCPLQSKYLKLEKSRLVLNIQQQYRIALITKVNTSLLFTPESVASRNVMMSEPWTQMRFVCAQESPKPGLYCLLDLCGEYEVALLHAVLEKGVRELMRALHEDYTKFQKFKGKVWGRSSQLTSGWNSVMLSE